MTNRTEGFIQRIIVRMPSCGTDELVVIDRSSDLTRENLPTDLDGSPCRPQAHVDVLREEIRRLTCEFNNMTLLAVGLLRSVEDHVGAVAEADWEADTPDMTDAEYNDIRRLAGLA